MSPRAVFSPEAPAPIGPYAQAVAANGFLFCSGQIPLDPRTGALVAGDAAAQAAQVLRNAAAVLAAEGLDASHVVKTLIFLVDMADFGAVNAVYAETFGAAPPARSTVAVAALPLGARVEIEIVAAYPTPSR